MTECDRDPGRREPESVWEYPRPPRVEPSSRRLQVFFGGVVIAETARSLRVLETSHPPTYYIPLVDILKSALEPNPHHTWCEFKGRAAYFDVIAGDSRATSAAWHYPAPAHGYEVLAGHVSFYPGRMEACFVDDERVLAQEGDFYGGWITSDVLGPFKGGPSTRRW